MPGGGFVVAWSAPGDYHVSERVLVRRFDARGQPLGNEVMANVPGNNVFALNPSLASAADGRFVVVWHRVAMTPPFVVGRAFDAAGDPAGPEFAANNYLWRPSVSAGMLGDFVVAWSSDASGSFDVVARRFTAAGVPRGAELRVNTYTTGDQTRADVASDPVGNLVVSWTSLGQDGSGAGRPERPTP